MLLRDLDYFILVAETGSLRRAAIEAEVTQPAITKGLRRLETELGLVLVERSRQGASLTESGRSFLDRARRLRRDLDAALQEANDLRAGALGLVRVGVTPALVEPGLKPACQLLMQQRPMARFRVTIGLVDELMIALRRGELDLVVSGEMRPAPPDTLVEVIGESDLAVVAREGHPLLRRRRAQLADFVDCMWMLPRRGVLSRDWVDAVFASRELPRPVVRLEFDAAHDGLIPLVLDTDLLTVAGESLLRRMHKEGLRAFSLAELHWRRTVAVTTRAQGAPSPLVRRFIDVLVGRAS